VGSASTEQGLLSVAFPPGFGDTGRFYVDYTDINGDTVVARYRTGPDPDVADANSEEVVLTIPQPFANHNGGQLAFGPRDGYLYIGMGDGGLGGDPGNRAQDPAQLLGKVLRIDVETGNPVTYTIPATNPFTQTLRYRGEIWALGLRNPWRISFDRVTGDVYVGDVGQSSREEIDFQPASSPGGENYGWRVLEGNQCFNPPAGCIPPSGYSPPVAEYDHSEGCSVTGGHVSSGVYFFGDFCSGRIWGLMRVGATWQTSLLLETTLGISTFGEGEDGSLYVADFGGGNIHRLNVTWLSHLPVVMKGA
ncbi:MAG TPA: PQQ-dependent sugar dehydrogenase, partial [Dehalococcoidia bacterium]|nr:PQQ-dependent sugar dehydrogenase [Dehalococcoidia bacterium]